MKRMANSSMLQRDEAPLDPQTWIQRHGDYLYRYAISRVRRGEAAEDLVQETLLAAWRGRKNYQGRASERSWLSAILKRKVIDWIRSSVRARNRNEQQTDDVFDQLFTRSGQWRAKPTEWEQGTPEAGLQRTEFWDTLHGCTRKLPQRQRDVFVLWHLEEEPADTVCREMKLTPANLWVLLHRARLRLWVCLSRNWYGVEPDDSESDGGS
jgi:RNA polymerase sigma-70 factor (TIGR02943 family)